jgi:outer membrane protein assembly factor BamB
VNDYFNWSSPTVVNGRIYVGSASACDKPLTRGSAVAFKQGSGKEVGRFFTVPRRKVGGGVWTSVAVARGGSVFTTTGTQVPGSRNRYESVPIVRLDGRTLRRLGSYTVPDRHVIGDGDFGGSPSVFGERVGACNRNGIFYTLNRFTMRKLWHRRLGASAHRYAIQCSAATVFDGSFLYVAGTPTTVGGVDYEGSVRRLDPRTGEVLWGRGLPNSVLGSPGMNGGGSSPWAPSTRRPSRTPSTFLTRATGRSSPRSMQADATSVSRSSLTAIF